MKRKKHLVKIVIAAAICLAAVLAVLIGNTCISTASYTVALQNLASLFALFSSPTCMGSPLAEKTPA